MQLVLPRESDTVAEIEPLNAVNKELGVTWATKRKLQWC